MADSMPAKSAQTPLQPGAASGSKYVTPNQPLEASQPSVPTPNPITSPAPTQPGGSGSPLVAPAQPMEAKSGIRNGGQVQTPTTQSGRMGGGGGSLGGGEGGDSGRLNPDIRVIDIPPPPHATQSTGGRTGYGS